MKRAYGHEPILLDSSPVTQPLLKQERVRKRRWIWVIVLAIVLLVGGIVSASMITSKGQTAVFSSKLHDTVSFSLYRPDWLPDGWFVDQQSIDATTEVVTFTANDGKGARVVFTEQRRPPQASIDTFYEQQLSETTSFDTPTGNGKVGQFEGSSLTGVTAGETWILVRAVSSAVEQQQLQRIAQNLVKE